MIVGDTAAISQGVGAFASRQAINAGSSALIAGASVRKQIIALAARILGVPEGDIDVDDGRAVARGGNKPSIALGELRRRACPAFPWPRDRRQASSTRPISPRRKLRIATARMWRRSRSTLSPAR
jgi:CO/xanthine dehydrogenase Mo-binding subunit